MIESYFNRRSPAPEGRLSSVFSPRSSARTLLPWLNSLPEAQAHLADHFGGNAINEVNLSDYRRTAFRRWEMRQAALECVSDDPDQTPFGTPVGPHPDPACLIGAAT